MRTGDFDRVYRRPARRQHSARFLVLASRNGLARTRWGLSVSARLGGAVVRNRIRRRLREILRGLEARLAPGWDVVVQPRTREVATVIFTALREELEALLAGALGTGEKP